MRKKERQILNALGYHEYRLKLSSDKSVHYIRTVATSEKQARFAVCQAEGCPPRAILQVKEIK